jgi:hypothetical protein
MVSFVGDCLDQLRDLTWVEEKICAIYYTTLSTHLRIVVSVGVGDFGASARRYPIYITPFACRFRFPHLVSKCEGWRRACVEIPLGREFPVLARSQGFTLHRWSARGKVQWRCMVCDMDLMVVQTFKVQVFGGTDNSSLSIVIMINIAFSSWGWENWTMR